MPRADRAAGRGDFTQRVAAVQEEAAAAGLIPGRGLTTAEVARRYRVSQTKVRGWIRAGKLKAIDTAEPGRKSRFIALPEHLAEFERGRSTAPPPKVPKRRRPSGIDFFPGD